MTIININLLNHQDDSYKIYLDTNIDFLTILKEHFINKTIVIITDKNVANIYLESLKSILKNDYEVLDLIIAPGEKSKNSKVKEHLESQMFKNKINRDSLIIALGGGVIGDLSGFIASTYMRGIKYIQMPTTLLAMVDSSVGGKTAINNRFGKNLIGSYYQPTLVFIDINTLHTLSKRHIINGLVEAIKIFILFDREYFEYTLNNISNILNLDFTIISNIIKRAIILKAKVVELDCKEDNLRMVLNLGHTIGHAIETISNYKFLHGYAVGIGILIESEIAVKFGHLAKIDFIKIKQLFSKLDIHKEDINKLDKNQIISSIFFDKKIRNHIIKCIQIKQIGIIARDDIILDVNVEQILSILNSGK